MKPRVMNRLTPVHHAENLVVLVDPLNSFAHAAHGGSPAANNLRQRETPGSPLAIGQQMDRPWPERPADMSLPRRARGTWYFVLVIVSAGVFAAVPFAHAAHRLRRPSLWWWTALYAAATVALMIIMPPSQDQPAASTTDIRSTIGGLVAIAIMVAACIQLSGIRRDVYGLPHPIQAPSQPPQPWATDPAVAAALMWRARREEARALVARDPALARDLRIGRPDLPRQYDDGGLVDINTAPPSVIAHYCGIDDRAARQIERARSQRSIPFQSVDELLVFAELDVSLWDLIRERAVVYS